MVNRKRRRQKELVEHGCFQGMVRFLVAGTCAVLFGMLHLLVFNGDSHYACLFPHQRGGSVSWSGEGVRKFFRERISAGWR